MLTPDAIPLLLHEDEERRKPLLIGIVLLLELLFNIPIPDFLLSLFVQLTEGSDTLLVRIALLIRFGRGWLPEGSFGRLLSKQLLLEIEVIDIW